ncbi:cryptochrome/photolyase family protein [Belliella baltica]|uniref:cryptochrome/photolyase family protein n=1 Tax=Belliella baltica TaxID=232259 RepID=UPI0002F70B6E
MKKTLRLILGDQLNIKHSWFQNQSSDITYLLMEMKQETDYVKHHIQKVVAFFLSMRNFTNKISKAGHHVIYLKLDDKENEQNLEKKY